MQVVNEPVVLLQIIFGTKRRSREDSRTNRLKKPQAICSVRWIALLIKSRQLHPSEGPGQDSDGFTKPTRVNSILLSQAAERHGEHMALPFAHFLFKRYRA